MPVTTNARLRPEENTEPNSPRFPIAASSDPSTEPQKIPVFPFEGLKEALTAGERIELRGFGVFSVRARKTGIGRNPRTGTEVSITPGKAVRFKPGKELHALDTSSSDNGK